MGWFTKEDPKPVPRPSEDGAFEAPNRTDRDHCWEARDGFFQCLDKHSIIDSLRQKEKASKECGKEDKEFQKNCATSWVCIPVVIASKISHLHACYRFNISSKRE
jgi:cytochrome c oxidase assembly factor 6